MSTYEQREAERERVAADALGEPVGADWILFSGIVLLVAGVLSIIYGIAAIDGSSFFNGDAEYIISDLNTWGWVTLILGILEIAAAFSIWAGNNFGRWFGIIVGCLAAIDALLNVPGYPLWSLATFVLAVLVVYGLAAYGGQHRSV